MNSDELNVQEIDDELDSDFLVDKDEFYKENKQKSISQFTGIVASVFIGFVIMGGLDYFGITIATNKIVFPFLKMPAFLFCLLIIWAPFILKQYTITTILSIMLILIQLISLLNLIGQN